MPFIILWFCVEVQLLMMMRSPVIVNVSVSVSVSVRPPGIRQELSVIEVTSTEISCDNKSVPMSMVAASSQTLYRKRMSKLNSPSCNVECADCNTPRL